MSCAVTKWSFLWCNCALVIEMLVLTTQNIILFLLENASRESVICSSFPAFAGIKASFEPWGISVLSWNLTLFSLESLQASSDQNLLCVGVALAWSRSGYHTVTLLQALWLSFSHNPQILRDLDVRFDAWFTDTVNRMLC